MAELALAVILACCLYLTLFRPWLGVLVLTVFGILHPQGYTGGAAAEWPVYKIAVAVLLVSVVASRETRSFEFLKARFVLFADWRMVGLGVLWLLFLNSTVHSLIPSVAWPKFLEISKILVTSLFALLLLDTRSKVRWFLLTVGVCIALVALKGGYWALMTGSVDRVYGPPGSQYQDNNHFAVLAIMALPLLALHLRRAGSASLRIVLGVAIGVTVIAVLTSWSRGALLSLGATLTLLALFTDRRLAVALLAVLGLVLALDLLPQAWFERMETITGFAQEGSAQGRLTAWREGLDFALRFPFTGAGPDGWLWTASRDWHSAYVEVLAEHGFPALGVWLLLLLGTLASLARCALRGGRSNGASCAAVFVALVGYAVGAVFLGLAYWEIYYQLLVVSVLLTKPEAHAVGLPSAGKSRLAAGGERVASVSGIFTHLLGVVSDRGR